ncbi:hypothetical protein IIB34_01550 [PVC group bacterium]|nr:hypothetical protein [PVC group bacterium]
MLHLQSVQVPIFRITLLGAFLHSLLLIVIIMILYFDFQKLALAVTIMFVVTNGLFTYVTHMSEISFLGYGYFFSALLTLAVSFYALDYRVGRLEYLTFATRPLAMHREEEVV